MKPLQNISTEELETIERYLQHDMTAEQETAFSTQLATDEALRDKVAEIELLLLAVKEAALKEKLDSFHKGLYTDTAKVVSVKKNDRVFPMGRKLLIAASLLAIVCLSIWRLSTKNNEYENLYAEYYTQDPGLITAMGNSEDYSFEKAMVEYKEGNYSKAIEAWTALKAKQPANDTLTYFLGVAQQAVGNKDQAIQLLSAITADSSKPFYKEACWYLGLLYMQESDTAKAVEWIKKSDHPKSEALLKLLNKN